MHCYATTEASKGYFDGFDNPPWDTWVTCVGAMLIAWVPPEFVELTNKAIDYEPNRMLVWLGQRYSDHQSKPHWTLPDWLNPYKTDGLNTIDERRTKLTGFG